MCARTSASSPSRGACSSTSMRLMRVERSSMGGAAPGCSIIELRAAVGLWAARPILPSQRPIRDCHYNPARCRPASACCGRRSRARSRWPAPPRPRLGPGGAARQARTCAERAGRLAFVGDRGRARDGAGRVRAQSVPAADSRRRTRSSPSRMRRSSSFGPAYRIETQVLGIGEQDGVEWHGDLVLKGFGDPTLSSLGLRRLAAEVRWAGIRLVTGPDPRRRVVLRHVPDRAGLEAALLHQRVSPALGADGRPRPLPRPRLARAALAAALLFRKALAEAGVRVVGPAPQPGAAPRRRGGVYPIASLLSPPLSSILRSWTYESDNFTAEILLKQLGTLESGRGRPPPVRSSFARPRRVRRAARRCPDRRRLGALAPQPADGDGLARRSCCASAWASPEFRDGFFSSLPVAARSGTLERRMVRTAAAGRVRAKTGTTRESSALSGIVKGATPSRSSRTALPCAHWSARRAQDRFAAILAAN